MLDYHLEKDKSIVCAFIVAFLVFCSFNPFFLWGFSFSSYLKNFVDIFFIIFWFYCVYVFKINRVFFYIAPFVLLWGLFRFYPYKDFSSLLPLFTLIIKLFFILMLPASILQKSQKSFSSLLAFFGFFTIINFVLILFTSSSLGHFELINPYKGKEEFGQNYIGYIFGSYLEYLKFCSSSFCFVRMNGAFDEPGLWGTVCALYLAAVRLDLSNRQNKIIFVSGFLSFSLAFYMLLAISAILNNFKKGISFVLILLFFSAILYFFSGSYFDELIINRISISHFLFERGGEELIRQISYVGISEFLFGQGYLSSLNVAPGASSWLVHLYEGGIVLLLLMVVIYFCLFLSYSFNLQSNHLNAFYYFPIILISFFQRPEIVWIGFMYLTLLAITYKKNL